MRLLLTAKLLIDMSAPGELETSVVEHLDGAARIALAAFMRPLFDGGVSLSTRATVDPADGDGTGDGEFPLSERDRLLAGGRYVASLEEARGLAAERRSQPAAERRDQPAAERGDQRAAAERADRPGASVLITATLPIESDSPAAVAEEIKPIDDTIRLMFYRSLLPLIEGGASQSTLVTLDPDDAEAQAEFTRRGWGGRLSRLSVSAPSASML